jgi:hypothetical protein
VSSLMQPVVAERRRRDTVVSSTDSNLAAAVIVALDREQVAQVVPVLELHSCSLTSQYLAFNSHSCSRMICRGKHARS